MKSTIIFVTGVIWIILSYSSTIVSSAPLSSSSCIDDSDYRFKNVSRKSCKWIGKKSNSKVSNLCKKRNRSESIVPLPVASATRTNLLMLHLSVKIVLRLPSMAMNQRIVRGWRRIRVIDAGRRI
jgi:hypothetical protein